MSESLSNQSAFTAHYHPLGLATPPVGASTGTGTSTKPLSVHHMVALLDELASGVLLCQANGRVLLANDAARRELLRGSPLALDATGCLATSTQADTRALLLALQGAVQRHRRQLVPLNAPGERLVSIAVPLGDVQGPPDCALLLLGRRQLSAELTLQMLASLYHLTNAECRVLAGLLEGKPVDEVARDRGVKLSTARAQVAALRAKMGVKRANDFALLAAEMPPMASALRCPSLMGLAQPLLAA